MKRVWTCNNKIKTFSVKSCQGPADCGSEQPLLKPSACSAWRPMRHLLCRRVSGCERPSEVMMGQLSGFVTTATFNANMLS